MEVMTHIHQKADKYSKQEYQEHMQNLIERNLERQVQRSAFRVRHI